MNRARRRLAGPWPWLGIVIAAVLIVGGLGIRAANPSPFDEWVHFDYVLSLADHADLPPRDSMVSETATQVFACDPPPGWSAESPGGWSGADCGKAGLAPFAGLNYVTKYMPTYYALTAVPTAAVHKTFAGEVSFLTATRIAQLGWLVLVASMAFGIAWLLGSGAAVAVAAGLLAAVNPIAILQTTHVTNDGAALGAVLLPVFLWLVLRSRPPNMRLLISLAAGVVAFTIKETAVIAIPAVLALETWARPESGPRSPGALSAPKWRVMLCGVMAAAACALLVFLNQAVRPELVAPTALREFLLAGELRSLVDFAGAVFSAIPLALTDPSGPYFGPDASLAFFNGIFTLVGSVAFGVCLMALFREGGSSKRVGALAILRLSALAGLLIVPLAYGLQLALSDEPLWFSSRYVAPAMTLAVVALAAGIRRRGSLFLGVAIALTVAQAAALIS